MELLKLSIIPLKFLAEPLQNAFMKFQDPQQKTNAGEQKGPERN